MIRRKHTLTVLAAAGLLTASFVLVHPTTHAQDTLGTSPSGEQATPPTPKEGGPGPKDGPKDEPGPRGERPPHPPRPDDVQGPVKPVDSNAAPAAVKTATDTLTGLTVGQVWSHTLPRGEQQVQASLVFQGKEVSRLEFDPATGALLARGQHTPPPPAPGGPTGPRDDRGPGTAPKPPVPADAPDAPPKLAAPAKLDQVKLDQVKDQLPDLLKGLSVGQGAEVMPREGYWKVALISGSRVVGELRLSGDGKTVVQDFGATRDAAMFAR